MADETDPSEQTFTDRDRRTVEAACSEVGFPLGGIDASGEVLRLRPTSLAQLPGADLLDELAGRLESLGFRYVTFTIPEDETAETE